MHSLRHGFSAACCKLTKLPLHMRTHLLVVFAGASWLLIAWSSLMLLAGGVQGMTTQERLKLRSETVDLFYHGYDNYLDYAFPEDELRPLTCGALTRDRANPAHIELNDVLGNYSLTLVDSLSTLAIMASSWSISNEKSAAGVRNKRQLTALDDFQDSIQLMVEYYGDGSKGAAGQGKRARGFDLDSKVQVFETVIRGVGGLLSAHLFAIGELPIRGYVPKWNNHGKQKGIKWDNGFVYDGQLLRLAKDLGNRLLPAFLTPTLLPYPRVNLRTGVPFYPNSPLNVDAETGLCSKDQNDKPEITETCSAGAGSLVLEFTTLSRLTGDPRFEVAAKNAFWAVWQRRSALGLIGGGIDAETGSWVTPYSGVGAGIDSFFEYAFKSHVLLSGLPYDANKSATHSPNAFLNTWQEAHTAIQRHVYRGDVFHHPHYIQSDMNTGAARAFWIDSLSAYYPGLLTLSGHVEEATASHLLYTALWTRYSALPERWSTYTGDIEGGLRWWGGRPEFIESSWYLYRATNDPWYLHIGEMTLKDIQRRCRTPCGWAGLQDVKSGEKTDRMESFFLGETAKYLYLLFDEDHPLNKLDAPFVLTTEGHPLIIPRSPRHQSSSYNAEQEMEMDEHLSLLTCPAPKKPLPFSVSNTAARGDIFHAAALARYVPLSDEETATESLFETESLVIPANVSQFSAAGFYPWTLSPEYIPSNGTCDKLMTGNTFDLTFPNYSEGLNSLVNMQRMSEGILVSSMSGIRFSMVRETDYSGEYYRVYQLGSLSLGRDEKVFLTRDSVSGFNPLDPYFTRVRDMQVIDLLVDVSDGENTTSETEDIGAEEESLDEEPPKPEPPRMAFNIKDSEDSGSYFSSLVQNLQLFIRDTLPTTSPKSQKTVPTVVRHILTGTTPTGPGTAPFSTLDDEPPALMEGATKTPLYWKSIYHVSHNLCDKVLDAEIPRQYKVLIVPRGGCSFSTKLQHIPSFPPNSNSLQLVVIIGSHPNDIPKSPTREWATSPRKAPDYESHTGDVKYDSPQNIPKSSKPGNFMPIQPHLDKPQLTPSGIARTNPISMILVEDLGETAELLKKAKGVAIRRRWWFESQKIRIDNAIVL